MNTGKLTRDDVARLAGVAPSTVSNVVNNKDIVSDKLRKKVLNAIKELNYTPNLVARSLMTKSSKHIGLIMEDITNPHFAEMAEGAQYTAGQNGYILSINLATKDIDQVVEEYIARHVDGIVFNAYYNFISGRVIDKLKASGIKCVCCGCLNNTDFYFIGIDYYDGMKKAYEYLMESGHKNISYISGQPADKKDNIYIDTRASAYEWCCINHGEGFNEQRIVFGTPPYCTNNKAGYEYCKELAGRRVESTAIIVANDYMALGVLQFLKENGKRIPEDISIISFDNTVYAETSYPGLTSMGVSAFEIGQKAVRSIIELCKYETGKKEEWLNVKLTVRGSTASIK